MASDNETMRALNAVYLALDDVMRRDELNVDVREIAMRYAGNAIPEEIIDEVIDALAPLFPHYL